MRAQPLPLPPAVAQFLATAAADYLDPYLDEAHGLHGGDHRRCPPPTQLFTHSLRAAWAERRARDPALPAALPAEASPHPNPNPNPTPDPDPNSSPGPAGYKGVVNLGKPGPGQYKAQVHAPRSELTLALP